MKIYKKKNLRGNALNLYKESLQKRGLTQTQKDILIGTLLGDASMQAMKGNQESNIKFEQKIGQIDYVEHLYEEFEE
jgi:LAGLIDADG DNA endonuclease family